MNEMQFAAINDSINLIDEKIKDELVLDQLSKEIGISKYHLHRMFKSITGKSLIHYVRGRKLSLSAIELLNIDLKVIDIANEYGYEQEQSYIRAFKQMFDITPAKFRKEKCELPFEQKIDLTLQNLYGDGFVEKPRMCLKSKFYLQGIKTEVVHGINLEENLTNHLAMDWKKNYMNRIPNQTYQDVYVGLVIYSEHPEYSNDYGTCVEIDRLGPVEAPMFQFTVPTLQYAVFRYIGFHSPYDINYRTIKELYDYTDRWMEECAYRQPVNFHFEKVV